MQPLMPHQREGVDFLNEYPKSILAHGMRLGKTRTAITYALRLRLLLSRSDAAHALGIANTQLDHLIACGALLAIRIGRRVLIHADDVSSFANAARGTSDP